MSKDTATPTWSELRQKRLMSGNLTNDELRERQALRTRVEKLERQLAAAAIDAARRKK